MKDLREALRTKNLTPKKLADRLGISEDYMHRILSRIQSPGAKLAIRIEKETKRAIKWSDLYEEATCDKKSSATS